MAKRIFLSTTKALLTVLPALHSLPWAYDSRPSDYHLNISFLRRAGRLTFRCCRASGYSRVRKPGCRHPSQACRSSGPGAFCSLSPVNHPGRYAALLTHIAVWICHSHPGEKLEASRKNLLTCIGSLYSPSCDGFFIRRATTHFDKAVI